MNEGNTNAVVFVTGDQVVDHSNADNVLPGQHCADADDVAERWEDDEADSDDDALLLRLLLMMLPMSMLMLLLIVLMLMLLIIQSSDDAF